MFSRFPRHPELGDLTLLEWGLHYGETLGTRTIIVPEKRCSFYRGNGYGEFLKFDFFFRRGRSLCPLNVGTMYPLSDKGVPWEKYQSYKTSKAKAVNTNVKRTGRGIVFLIIFAVYGACSPFGLSAETVQTSTFCVWTG